MPHARFEPIEQYIFVPELLLNVLNRTNLNLKVYPAWATALLALARRARGPAGCAALAARGRRRPPPKERMDVGSSDASSEV